jgi:hypothetical protein
MTGEIDRQPLGIGCEEIPLGRAGGVERPNIEDFEGIYRQYSKRVYSLCLRMTGNEAEAQGLTQEAFLHLFCKLDTFRGVSTFYQSYAQRPRVADLIAEWICRQSKQYRQALSGGEEPRLPS